MRMTRAFAAAAALLVMPMAALSVAHGAENVGPLWAYPQPPTQPAPPEPEDTRLKSVPNSTLRRTLRQAGSSQDVPDWHPNNHPAAPDIILHGHNPISEACGHCHLPNGRGGPMTAPALAGLPATYILQTLADFRGGARSSAIKWSAGRMMSFVLRATDPGPLPPGAAEDLKQAAEYYAALPAKPSIRVVEASMVPQIKYEDQIYVAVAGAPKQAIGNRIVEVPEDAERTALRDSETGFVAYVPPGSIERGEALVTRGRTGVTACVVCHGVDLRGLGPVPPLAGRSPSYLARQIYDMQSGTRAGEWSELMIPVVPALTQADIVAIAAYAASRSP
jgi:cytochrome c553